MTVRPPKSRSSSSQNWWRDFPHAKELMEYEDHISHPTKATASALITLALESNWDKLSSDGGLR